jgi:hypothetical protein
MVRTKIMIKMYLNLARFEIYLEFELADVIEGVRGR